MLGEASSTVGATIIDSHTHCWRLWPYARVSDAAARASCDRLLEEMDLNGVDEAIVVSASIDRNPDNLEYVHQACASQPDRLRMFAEFDCIWAGSYHTPGGADRLRALTERYELCGVAHYLGERNDGWLLSAEADAVFAAAAESRLLVSIGATPNWQADLRHLARRHPTVPVLCHALGLVPEAGGPDSEALSEVLASAAASNIYVKVCGFHYCATRPWDYPWPGVASLLSRIFDAYGPERLCWGSDFPASTRYCTFRQSLEVLRSHCGFLGRDDLSQMLGGTLTHLLAARSATA